jgi:hypothetical protein
MDTSRPLYLHEIAHVIVSNKVGIVNLLRINRLGDFDWTDEESIFRVVLENKHNKEIRLGIFELHDKNPLNQHCNSCFDIIRGLYDAGIEINSELKSEKS